MISLVRCAGFTPRMLFSTALNHGSVATVAVTQETRDAPDRGDADAGLVMYLAIWNFLEQQPDHLPAVNQCLQFRGGAQVAEKIPAIPYVTE